jgi:hypothetical protein
MDHFVKKSKNPMNCLSNHRLIVLLIHNGMGINNDPLPKPIPVLAITVDPKQSNPVPSTAPTVNTLTVTARKSTLNTKQKIQSTSHTTQKCLESLEPEHLNPLPLVVVEPTIDNEIPRPNHEPQPSTAIVVFQELPRTLKAKKRKFLPSISTLPRTRTRSERSTVTTAPTSIAMVSTSIPYPVAPTTTQNPPVVVTTVLVSTVSANELIQPAKCQSRREYQKRIDIRNSPSVATTVQNPIITATKSPQKSKPQPTRKSKRGINKVVQDASTEYPESSHTQTLPEFMEIVEAHEK